MLPEDPKMKSSSIVKMKDRDRTLVRYKRKDRYRSREIVKKDRHRIQRLGVAVRIWMATTGDSDRLGLPSVMIL